MNEENIKRKKLLIIGNGSQIDLTETEGKYIASNLAGCYDAIAGTFRGNPGFVLNLFDQQRNKSAQLYSQTDRRNGETKEFGNNIRFHGETKEEFRETAVAL